MSTTPICDRAKHVTPYKEPYHQVIPLEVGVQLEQEVSRLQTKLDLLEVRYQALLDGSEDALAASQEEVARLTDCQTAEAQQVELSVQYLDEIAKLRAQIHELCHDKHLTNPAVTVAEFCGGCEAFQVKLFGCSPIAALREDLAAARADADRLRTAISVNGAPATTPIAPLGRASRRTGVRLPDDWHTTERRRAEPLWPPSWQV